MFFGTNPQIISQFLAEELKRQKPKRVLVGFAGNFVLEQITGIIDKSIPVISTDVSLYSRALGYAFADMKSEIKIQKDILDVFPSLSNNSPFEIGVAAIFLAEIATLKNKQKIPYYRNLYRDSIANQDMYLEQIRDKMNKFMVNMPENFTFLGTDGIKLVEQAKEGDLFFYDPPVLLGDYEKMFKPLEDCFDFIEPIYTQMTDEVKSQNLQLFNDSNVITYYRNNNPLPEPPKGYTEVFRYKYKYSAAYCVYTNRPKSNWVGTFSPLKEEVLNIPIIGRKDIITEDSVIKFIPCKSAVSNHYRLMWVKKAEMSDVGNPYLILIDDKLIGIIQLMNGIQFNSHLAVIISDPAAPSSRYRRLSKLILKLVCTQELLENFNEKNMWEHNGFTTRVFTNGHVSMKYRSQFKLVERKEDKDGFFNFCLIYQNRDKILPTFKDDLKAWLRKDAKFTNVTPIKND